MNEVLRVENLNKKVKGRVLINNLSFKINKGEVLGFLGPNGAGKTTVMRMILGIIKPTSGEIFINGYNVQKEHSKAMSKVAGIVSSPSHYMYLSGYENLMQRVRLMEKTVTQNELNEIISLVGLEGRIYEKVKNYSLGMKQRLGIASALIGQPQIIILDEPINGMDPEGVIAIRELILHLAKKRGITVFISSHLLGELEYICDKILIINNGVQVLMTDVEMLKDTSGIQRFLLEFSQESEVIVNTVLKKLEIIYEFNGCTVKWNSTLDMGQLILKECINNGVIISSFQSQQKNLEEIYLDAIQESEEFIS